MSSDHRELSRIEAYTLGTLPEKERRLMDAAREKDAELDAAIREFEEIKAGIDEAGKAELRKKIRSWEEKTRKQEPGTRIPGLRIAAAAAVIIGCVAGLYFLLPQEDSYTGTAYDMFTPYPGVNTERGSTPASALDSLFIYYEAGNYSAVVQMFENRRNSGDDLEGLRDFYLAESFIAEGRFKDAASLLADFDDREHALFEVARFHYALALILSDRKREGQNTLRLIATEDGPYQEKAEQLLARIEG